MPAGDAAPFVIGAWGLTAALVTGALMADRRGKRQVVRAAAWPTVGGTVVDAVLQSNSSNFQPLVSYTYVVAGRGYASDRMTPGGTPVFVNVAKARAALAPFVAGQPVTVSYDPADPSRSAIVLRATNPLRNVLAIMAGTMLVMALLLTILVAQDG